MSIARRFARFGVGSRLLVGFVAFLLLASAALATDRFTGEPEAVLEGTDAAPWALIERHGDPHPRFPQELFHRKLHQFFPQVIQGFGTKTPHSSKFLLHVAPGWDQATRPVPVLLLPGANDDATRRYARPLSTHHDDFATTPGLMQHLAAEGFAVFAISFSHYHGDNRFQGEAVANAITRIRQLLGHEGDEGFKVDLITYSKGAMAARCYLTDAGQWYGDSRFLTPYRGDVRRVIFQAGPIGGLDLPYRYYAYNLSLLSNDVPGPVGCESMMIYGFTKSAGDLYILSGCWTGQLQMLSDTLDLGVPYGPLSATPDAGYSALVLKKGGSSLILKSPGLDAAIAAGGSMIERMNERGLPPDVTASLVAGTKPVIFDELHPHIPLVSGMQVAAPNDGLLFLASAFHEKGLTARGAKVTAKKSFFLNHIELSRSDEVFEYVTSELSGE